MSWVGCSLLRFFLQDTSQPHSRAESIRSQDHNVSADKHVRVLTSTDVAHFLSVHYGLNHLQDAIPFLLHG